MRAWLGCLSMGRTYPLAPLHWPAAPVASIRCHQPLDAFTAAHVGMLVGLFEPHPNVGPDHKREGFHTLASIHLKRQPKEKAMSTDKPLAAPTHELTGVMALVMPLI